MIYYGDEIGMEGGKDPDCRRCMIWDTTSWNSDLLSHYKKLTNLRKESVALRRGAVDILSVKDDKQLIVFKRSTEQDSAIIIFNNADTEAGVTIPVAGKSGKIRDALSEERFTMKERELTVPVPPRSGRIFLV